MELYNTKIEELDKFVDKFISQDFVLHLPGGVDISGKEGLKDYCAGSKMAFTDAAHTVDDVIAEGNKVAFRATTKGTHQGEFMGIQPTEKDIKVTFDGFCQIQEGKIAEWWSEYAALGMMMQLGMELKPKEVKK
jgi:predicted ester cyclase